MKNNEIDDSKINYDVYNGLNLYSPFLGEQYAKFQWNPLGEDFSLDISFIERFLENAKNGSELNMPQFMENEPENVLDTIKLATKRNKEIIDELQNKYDNNEYKSLQDTNIEKQIEEILFILKCRQKMFEISIGQLKSKNIDAFTAYKNISGLNKKLSQLLEEAYTEEWNKKIALQNMLSWAQQRSKDNADLYTKKPFIFDALKHSQQVKQGNFFEDLMSSIKGVANAFTGQSNMTLNDIPEFQDYVDSFQNLPQRPIRENTNQNSNIQENSNGKTFNL